MSKTITWGFEMDIEAQDRVTKFGGVITARAEYVTGCRQYLLSPPVDKEGKMPEGEWIDEVRVVKVERESLAKIEKRETGGPQRNTAPIK